MKSVAAFLLLLPILSFGHGSVTNSTQGDLEAALEGGGLVRIETTNIFNLTNTINIVADTILEGFPYANLRANNTRIFTVAPGIKFTIRNAKLENGFGHHSGGGAIAGTNIVLHLENSLFQGNSSWARGSLDLFRSRLEATNLICFSSGINFLYAEDSSIFLKGSFIFRTGVSFSGTNHATIENTHFSPAEILAPYNSYVNASSNTISFFQDCSFSDGPGTAVYLNGTAFFNRCSFINNTAKGSSGGYLLAFYPGPGKGGAIYNSGTLSVSNSLFYHNIASGGDYHFKFDPPMFNVGSAYGGAIFNDHGTASVYFSTFSRNVAQGSAWEVFAFPPGTILRT